MSTQLTVTVKATSEQMKTEVEAGKHNFIIDEPERLGGQDEGPDPLSTLLGSLVSCKNVVIKLVTKEMDFKLGSVAFEANGDLDMRGLMGDSSVRTYFETVSLKVILETEESQERIAELQERAEARCPVFQTLKAANVELKTVWERS